MNFEVKARLRELLCLTQANRTPTRSLELDSEVVVFTTLLATADVTRVSLSQIRLLPCGLKSSWSLWDTY